MLQASSLCRMTLESHPIHPKTSKRGVKSKAQDSESVRVLLHCFAMV